MGMEGLFSVQKANDSPLRNPRIPAISSGSRQTPEVLGFISNAI